MYDEAGKKVWEAELDIYGKVRTFEGSSSVDCPFRYQGQYEDAETGLYYNRFRYYSPDEGMYLAQDPLRLLGHKSCFYSYVNNPNIKIDIFGLKGETSPYLTRYDPSSPGRPNPSFSIDTGNYSSGIPTANGGMRDSRQFWKDWYELNPESISKNNKWKIDNGFSPKIDDTWIACFPEHVDYKGEVLIHHHVDQGKYAVPVPSSTHVGSGGVWHCK